MYGATAVVINSISWLFPTVLWMGSPAENLLCVDMASLLCLCHQTPYVSSIVIFNIAWELLVIPRQNIHHICVLAWLYPLATVTFYLFIQPKTAQDFFLLWTLFKLMNCCIENRNAMSHWSECLMVHPVVPKYLRWF